MVEFANMGGLEVDGKTSKPFEFLMENKVVYTVNFRPALEENKEYADGALLLAQKNGRDANRKGKQNVAKQMKRSRREDMALFSKFCATSWDGIKDIKGHDVEFSQKNCFELLTQLPTRYQDALRGWIRVSANFLPDGPDAVGEEFDLDDLEEITSLDDLDDVLKTEADDSEKDDLGKS